ncbi:MAG: hypothetical protein U0905_12085 [Pirellulales bacterium]
MKTELDAWIRYIRIWGMSVGLAVTLCSVTRAEEDPPTFSGSIASIFYAKCTQCHREGQSGPFVLQTYEEVVKHSNTIRAVVQDGYMPPWKPVDSGIAFAHDRRLTKEERALLLRWIDNACPQGDANATPAPPKFPTEWALGQPDLVVRMDRSFQVPADGPDLYRSFVFQVGLPEDKWIKAMELKPTARGAVHHALFFVDQGGVLRKERESDGLPGFRGMNFLKGRSQGGNAFVNVAEGMGRGLGGYVPGATPNRLPGDLARLLPAGSDIIMQTHFHPTGKVEHEQAELAIYFADQPPSRLLVPLQLPALFGLGAGLEVPAGEKNFHLRDSYTLPVDVEAFEIGGHAHYICTRMDLTATTPDGKTSSLLKIEDWDLDWQDQYQFAQAVRLPKGTRLDVDIVYDNSSDNADNPHSPPQTIAWGRESNDEMGSVTLLVVADREEDRKMLERDMRKRSQEAIRNRIEKQSGRLGTFAGGALGDGRFAKLFDLNRDGVLEASEVPERLRTRLFEFLDENRDDRLDAKEIERGRKSIREVLDDRSLDRVRK